MSLISKTFSKVKENLSHPKAIIVFLSVLITIFLIDGLTKQLLFDSHLAKLDVNGVPGYSDYKVIGIRSFPHDNSTVFSSLNVSMSLGTRIFINILLAVIFTIPMLFTRSVVVAIGLGILVGGILGNGLDIIAERKVWFVQESRWVTHYVRDVFYTPWSDRGTFNAADFFIIAGAGTIFVRTVVQLFKKD